MWDRLFRDDQLNRLAIGRFLREWLVQLDGLATGTIRGAVDGTGQQRQTASLPAFQIYSGHDSTLFPLLAALQIQVETTKLN
jgi:hypothetical protein